MATMLDDVRARSAPALRDDCSAKPRPRVLVVTHVLPFPAVAGQRQRVLLTLQALRERFHVTVATAVPRARSAETERELLRHCDAVELLPHPADAGPLRRTARRAASVWHATRTGERVSNYVVGHVLFPPERLEPLVAGGRFDLVVFEYWHASRAADTCRAHGVPTVLDMHNVIWHARDRQLGMNRRLPAWLRRLLLARYRRREERAWRRFDALIAINRAEYDYARSRTRADGVTLLAGMGVSLEAWPYRWQPAHPPRVAYYGGLGTAHNQESARRCAERVMPLVWAEFPEAELWIVGSNPPDHIRALEGPKIRVTGFVDDVGAVLAETTAVLCPWEGTYGFRSRLIEAMALGVPVVASPDAVHGMDLDDGRGLLLGEGDEALATHVRRLLREREYATAQSEAARAQVEAQYSFERTYGKLTAELAQWLGRADAPTTSASATGGAGAVP